MMGKAENQKEKKIFLPLGIDHFAKLRREGCFYVDKTELIGKLLRERFEVQLITRPRRFGKTLMMSMLEDFFDIGRDSRADFDGLAVSEDAALCAEWQNRWPALFLTLKSVEGNTYEDAYGMFRVLIADLCKKYAFLEQSDRVDADDRAKFLRLKAETADETALKNSLHILSRMLHAHYGKPVILLIDEYDVPLAKANEKGYYGQMLNLIRALFDKAMKTNEHLKFAVVTGCLKIAKESVFTGMNNFVTDTISDSRLDEYIGFTGADVRELLAAVGISSYENVFREWYDGYRFGNVDVYCPWDVLNYARALQADQNAEPEAWWANTSGNAVLQSFLRKAGRTTRREIEELIAGGSVAQRINGQLTYNELEKNMENLWSYLYMTGYLTTKGRLPDGRQELVIPNQELHEIFVSQIREWFEKDVVERETDAYSAFCRAFAEGDAAGAEKHFQAFLLKSISIRDTFVHKPKKENFYRGLLLGMFLGRDDWCVYSNHEDGDGYSDIHVEIEEADTAFVVEVKYAENSAMEAACQKALRQIERMRYADGLRELGFGTIYAYGIACYKKRCRVVCMKCGGNT